MLALACCHLSFPPRTNFLELNVLFYIIDSNAKADVHLMSFPCNPSGNLYIVAKKFKAFKDSRRRERFNEQAPKIFTLQHENIVRTYAIVECGAYIRILMEPMDNSLEKLRAEVSLFFLCCN